MSFAQRLKDYRKAAGLTQQQVAEFLDIQKATYSGYETGRREPDMEKLRAIALVFSISGDDLLCLPRNAQAAVSPQELSLIKKYRVLDVHGKDMTHAVLEKEYDRMTRHEDATKEEKDNLTFLSCYDLAVSAGTGEPLGETYYKTRLEIPTARVPETAHYCLRVNGDSMEPAYQSGDIVFIQRCETVSEGEIGIFTLNGEGFIKRLGAHELISLNPHYPPIPLHDFDRLSCQGRVLGKI